ncbi:HIRAN domain-containing protein [Sphingobium sp. EP60837]|uniref:HIRAN domain-containing protein n=1 Tax=Sphingobium sp. EP60837 TaxID=1855519 RepID=UPI0018D35497|nr:HIRAN domain-containing protein [Sphingobium sp. EP60837]
MRWLSRLLGGGTKEPKPSFRTYTLGIVGESHKNPDGSFQQAEIKRCREGEAVQLIAEPHNPSDPLAVAVLSRRGTCIGYISREHNEWISEKLATDGIASACIDMIVGGGRDKPSRAVLLELKML